jgi:hypothetical protein
MTNPLVTTHERFEADLAELAAGVLDRGEEAALLSHLASCSSCTTEFEQLASAARSLLLLVLEIEPPVGFESRLLDRLGGCSSDTADLRIGVYVGSELRQANRWMSENRDADGTGRLRAQHSDQETSGFAAKERSVEL